MDEPAGKQLCHSVFNKYNKCHGAGANTPAFPRDLRAISKCTSAGLTGSQRQRAESPKERISALRVLSLGSISIIRDDGVASGCTVPIGEEEIRTNTGELTRIMPVK